MNGLMEQPAVPRNPAAAAAVQIGYLGGKSDHWENLTRLFASIDRPITALPTSTSNPAYRKPPALLAWKPASILHKKVSRVLGQLRGTRNKTYVREVVELVDKQGLDCVVAYWSTEMLGDLMAIKKLRPKVKLILNCLCHPLGLSTVKVALQNWHFRRSVHVLDGLIMPSHAMHEYLKKNVLAGRGASEIPTLIFPPYYANHFFPANRKQAVPHSPNLLFLGRMDYYRAQPSDDVRSFVNELLEKGVHVYHSDAKGNPAHPNRHVFQYLPLVQAEEYATSFDASLILYNLKACRKTERFDVTVFDRLVASVTAGIPVAIPAEGYSASMEYVKDYEAVIPFATADDLARRLGDRAAMARMKLIAAERSKNYIGERHLHELTDFVQRVVQQ